MIVEESTNVVFDEYSPKDERKSMYDDLEGALEDAYTKDQESEKVMQDEKNTNQELEGIPQARKTKKDNPIDYRIPRESTLNFIVRGRSLTRRNSTIPCVDFLKRKYKIEIKEPQPSPFDVESSSSSAMPTNQMIIDELVPLRGFITIRMDALDILKGYVKNRSRPEGCIAERYIVEETLDFCTGYLEDSDFIGIPKLRFAKRTSGEGITGNEILTISRSEMEQE
ncbi:hypothetical protein Lal_00031355 [Lupinus albus]|nr:hypothetical protein Lal_00031355 [Lupinus albus]